MSIRLPHGAVAALIAAAAAAGCSTDAGTAGATRAAAGLSCDIRVSNQAGGVAINGIVAGVSSGTYSFRVRGGGTDIEQGGPFSAGQGPTSVGDVTLGRGRYDVLLTVSAGGSRQSCSKRVG